MAKLEIQMQKKENLVKIKLIGQIDEEASFPQNSLLGAENVEMDLLALTSINSLGIKAWADWLSAAKDAKYIFLNCPEIFVHQANIMEGFLPRNFKIQSFFIPYYLENEELDRYILFDYDTHYSKDSFTFPEQWNEEDGKVFRIGVNLKRYLKFLQKSEPKIDSTGK